METLFKLKNKKSYAKSILKKVKPQKNPQVEPTTEPQVEPATEPIIEPQVAPVAEPKVEAPKQGRPRKYQTEEGAKEKARVQRKQFKQRLREKQKVFKSGISELQLSAQKLLNKVVLSKEDLIKILEIIEGGPKEQTDDTPEAEVSAGV
ncbi:MAG: hypothetical protein EZS28_021446 [Streblomastix strix]|uniref:Uncharacterized protein n=1 Tax=Streblomastix strix TaxID=222440 RepID=A0A5J4VKP3_9EUKA|nr:MAG: hypothetical protein EZS28_021446 [Streblomastix strix]